jgi:hypothetical protein
MNLDLELHPWSTGEVTALFIAAVVIADVVAVLTVLDKDRHQRLAWWPLAVDRPQMFMNALVLLNLFAIVAIVSWLVL